MIHLDLPICEILHSSFHIIIGVRSGFTPGNDILRFLISVLASTGKAEITNCEVTISHYLNMGQGKPLEEWISRANVPASWPA